MNRLAQRTFRSASTRDDGAKSSEGARQLLLGSRRSAEGSAITLSTGNEYQRELDYSGPGPFPLLFERHYNSAAVTSGRVGTLWLHTYERTLQVVAIAPYTWAFQALRPDGHIVFFSNSASTSGTYVADADNVETLTSIGLGGSGGWTLVDGDDNTETYNSNGVLLSIKSRAGVVITLSYDGSGNLTTVADPFGHQLTFAYDGSGNLTTMTDPAGGQYTYQNSSGNLTSVTYPGNATRTYV